MFYKTFSDICIPKEDSDMLIVILEQKGSKMLVSGRNFFAPRCNKLNLNCIICFSLAVAVLDII